MWVSAEQNSSKHLSIEGVLGLGAAKYTVGELLGGGIIRLYLYVTVSKTFIHIKQIATQQQLNIKTSYKVFIIFIVLLHLLSKIKSDAHEKLCLQESATYITLI